MAAERSATILPFPPTAASAADELQSLQTGLAQVLQGKGDLVDALLCAVIGAGHVLIEDVPGVGKTTAIKALAQLLGLEMKRIQCTSDLLPADILGVEVYNPKSTAFEFHPGPVFSQVVFADELNRASPRTQSALLEAMGEGAVTVNRRTYALPQPFLFFAAQNPTDHLGTYPLPESQLDRFSLRLSIEYPVAAQETTIFKTASLTPLVTVAKNVIRLETLQGLQAGLEGVHISDRIVQYLKRVVDASRASEEIRTGISTRGGLLWLRLARARALLYRRDYVIPEDLLALAIPCLAHRINVQSTLQADAVMENLLAKVEID